TSDPEHPSYCPVSPTEPLTKPLRAPANRYLLLIAAADPLTVATLRDRLRSVDLGLRGRELVADVALHATGVTGERWAAVAVALCADDHAPLSQAPVSGIARRARGSAASGRRRGRYSAHRL